MGMDLVPSRTEAGTEAEALHYNWSGWAWLQSLLTKSGTGIVLAGTNDGERLTAQECRTIAATIEEHAREYNRTFSGPAYGESPAHRHAEAWRTSRGMRQW